MAEEPTSGLQNWKLLVIALVLAVVAAIVYNFHISFVREAAKGKSETRLVYTRDLQPGEKITLRDIEPVSVETQYLARFENIAKPDEKDSILGRPVNQKVTKDHWVLWSHVQEDAGRKPADNIKEGMIAHTVDVNPQMTPGNMLRVGDRVNLCAMLPEIGGKVRAMTIIEGVKVLAIGGRTISDRPVAGRADDTAATYRSLTLELPQSVAQRLVNVLTHRSGDPWVDLCPTGFTTHMDSMTHSEKIDLTKEVQHLEAPAIPVTPHE